MQIVIVGGGTAGCGGGDSDHCRGQGIGSPGRLGGA